MIRAAKAVDIPRIIDLAEEVKSKSRYAANTTLDRDYAQGLFLRFVMAQNSIEHEGTLFLLSEKNGVVEGYHIAYLDRLYQLAKELAPTEFQTVLSDRADGSDLARFVAHFIVWSQRVPNIIEMVYGESDIMGEPDPRFGALLQRKGFRRAVTIYKRGCETASQRSAA